MSKKNKEEKDEVQRKTLKSCNGKMRNVEDVMETTKKTKSRRKTEEEEDGGRIGSGEEARLHRIRD